eukprot:3182241-Amphidinium_carterae.1
MPTGRVSTELVLNDMSSVPSDMVINRVAKKCEVTAISSLPLPDVSSIELSRWQNWITKTDINDLVWGWVGGDLEGFLTFVRRWVHAHPLPAKISEARLYSLETRLAQEMDARLQFEDRMR